MSRSSVHHLAMQIVSELLLRKGECSVRGYHGPWLPVLLSPLTPQPPATVTKFIREYRPKQPGPIVIFTECAHCGTRVIPVRQS